MAKRSYWGTVIIVLIFIALILTIVILKLNPDCDRCEGGSGSTPDGCPSVCPKCPKCPDCNCNASSGTGGGSGGTTGECPKCPTVFVPPGALGDQIYTQNFDNSTTVMWPENTYFPNGYQINITCPGSTQDPVIIQPKTYVPPEYIRRQQQAGRPGTGLVVKK
jgi:hypothetical protein